MHILKLHTADTVRRAKVVLDEDGGALSNVPVSAVLEVEVTPGDASSVVAFELTQLSPRRWYHDFTAGELAEFTPSSTLMPCKVVATYENDTQGVFPTGEEEEDFLYLMVLATPEPES